MRRKPRFKVFQRLRNKYRLVVLNDETFEEKLSFKLSRLNVFVAGGILSFVLIAGTTLLIAYTPLREYIPGYSSAALKRTARALALRTDSLELHYQQTEQYLNTLKRIIEQKPLDTVPALVVVPPSPPSEGSLMPGARDSNLRAYVEREERYTISAKTATRAIENLSFFSPVKGIVSRKFEHGRKHVGIDILSEKNAPVKSCLDGVVVFAEWTTETGYVLIVQHENELMSAYKHNSALLKRQGDPVRAGEPVAIIGNSGEQSNGPHLHFELWHKGYALDPETLMRF
ncbi:peptidoglycan DD-metalloendopeptidase family protein [bacterium]|nr:peptidoglycan DD-metalloendopeptidase family protein [bacterium]